MQGLLSVAVATAPIVAKIPKASNFYSIYSGFFCALWLIAAAFFRAAAQSD